MIPYGVYAGKDVELVVVDKHILAFRKIIEQNCLESCHLRKDISTGKYLCAGICRSIPIHSGTNSRPRRWEYVFPGQKKVYGNNKQLSACIGQSILNLLATEKGIEIEYWDGRGYTAAPDEVFTMEDILPSPLSISAENIGECLKYWHMGCFEETIESDKDIFTGVTINTGKHMYIFQMLPNSFYCRAARYATCNRGVLFFQNFRQRKSSTPETYMAEDNRIALQPLSVHDSDIETFACSLVSPEYISRNYLNDLERRIIGYRFGVMGNEKLSQRQVALLLGISKSSVARIAKKAEKTLYSHMPNASSEGIYWLVESFTDTQVVLNGCAGDLYHWEKPER